MCSGILHFLLVKIFSFYLLFFPSFKTCWDSFPSASVLSSHFFKSYCIWIGSTGWHLPLDGMQKRSSRSLCHCSSSHNAFDRTALKNQTAFSECLYLFLTLFLVFMSGPQISWNLIISRRQLCQRQWFAHFYLWTLSFL